LKRDINIDLVTIQSKTSKGFSEDALNKLIAVTNDLLNFENPLGDFRSVYNNDRAEFRLQTNMMRFGMKFSVSNGCGSRN
jgi:hypothetical protein